MLKLMRIRILMRISLQIPIPIIRLLYQLYLFNLTDVTWDHNNTEQKYETHAKIIRNTDERVSASYAVISVYGREHDAPHLFLRPICTQKVL